MGRWVLILSILLVPMGATGADEADSILGGAAGLFGEQEESSQGEAPVSGYVENNARILQEPGDPWDWRVQDAGKIKIRLTAAAGQLRSHAEINTLYYAGLTELQATELLPASLAPIASGLPPLAFENTIEVAQAYGVLPVGPLQLTVGRQPLALGTGYAWNPVDPFSRKDSREPTYEVTALDAVKLTLPLPLNGEARLAVILGDQAEQVQDLSALLSARVNLLFDWEGSLSTHRSERVDPGTGFTLQGRENVVGLANSGQLGELGLHAEGAWVISDFDANHLRALIGGDYTFGFQNRVLVEGLFDGRGSTGGYTAAQWLSYIWGEVPVLGQVYLFASSTQTVLDTAEVEIAILFNGNDSSGLVLPAVSVNFSEIVVLRLSGMLGWGSEDSEFGVYPPMVELRATAYF